MNKEKRNTFIFHSFWKYLYLCQIRQVMKYTFTLTSWTFHIQESCGNKCQLYCPQYHGGDRRLAVRGDIHSEEGHSSLPRHLLGGQTHTLQEVWGLQRHCDIRRPTWRIMPTLWGQSPSLRLPLSLWNAAGLSFPSADILGTTLPPYSLGLGS